MAETLESFVEKLQTEGVQAGQTQAEQIIADARTQAQQIVAEAQAQADEIRKQAELDAQAAAEKGRTELRLAARDTIYSLRETLARVLRAVMAKPVEEQLQRKEFLGKLLHEVVLQYAQADSGTRRQLDINVPEEQYHQLAEWALDELRHAVRADAGGGGAGVSIDLKGTLREAGFEYRVEGGTIEVTVDSVVSKLVELVSPRLREIMDQVVQSQQEQG